MFCMLSLCWHLSSSESIHDAHTSCIPSSQPMQRGHATEGACWFREGCLSLVLPLVINAMQVVENETEKGEWGFRALKQMMKLHFKLVCPELP